MGMLDQPAARCLRSPHRRGVLVAGALLGPLVIGGCGGGGRGTDAHRAADLLPAEFTQWEPPADPFLPTRMRIHPLTRITHDAGGAPVLMCHVELRDADNQVARRLGIVQVELFRADARGRIRDPDAAPERAWPIDLRSPAQNAGAFDDVVTRTYALLLSSLPAGVAAHADGAVPAEGDDPEGRYALRVRFLFKDATGRPLELLADAPLTPR